MSDGLPHFGLGRWAGISEYWLGKLTKARTLRVYLALALHAKHDGTCFPALSTVSATTGIARQHIQEALRELEELGAIRHVVRPGRSSVYLLVSPPPIDGDATKTVAPLHGMSYPLNAGATKSVATPNGVATKSVAEGPPNRWQGGPPNRWPITDHVTKGVLPSVAGHPFLTNGARASGQAHARCAGHASASPPAEREATLDGAQRGLQSLRETVEKLAAESSHRRPHSTSPKHDVPDPAGSEHTTSSRDEP